MDLVTRKCTRCKNVKPISEFYRDSSRPCGIAYRCKCCAKTDTRNFLNNNLEKNRAYQRNRYATNPSVREAIRAYNKINPEKRREYYKKWYYTNQKAATEKSADYRAANHEKCLARTRTWNINARTALSDSYVKQLFRGLPQIPEPLINLKRVQVLIKRKLKELKNANDSNRSTG